MKNIWLICLFSLAFAKISNAQSVDEKIFYFKELFPESGLFLRPDSLPDGKWIAYCKEKSSQIGLVIHYKNGKRNGECVIYWPSGAIHKKFSYLNGIGFGKSESWYKNGKKESESDGAQNNRWNYWTEDGTQIIKEGNGYYIGYHPNGALQIKGKYVNGLQEGEWKWYRESGKVLYIENFVNGKQNGDYIFYFENGQIRTFGQYQNGKMEGIWKEWNIDGKQISVLVRNNGAANGEYISWYDNGNMQSKGVFKVGKEDGKWEYWNEDGSLKRVVTFANGKKL